MKKTALERCKSLLIVLLCLGVLVLGYQNWLLDVRLLETPSLSWLAFVPKALGLYKEPLPAPVREQDIQAQTALWPAKLAINRGGERRGFLYEESNIETAYAGIAARLGEALGSAQTPKPVDRDTMYAALSADGIYLEYTAAIPLYLLAEWLSVSPAEGLQDAVVVRILLAEEEGKQVLYYIDWQYNAYRAQTPLEYSAPQWPEASLCTMGYEREASKSMPYTLLPETQFAPLRMSVRNAEFLDGYRRAVMTRLAFNPELRGYLSVDGSHVYVDDSQSAKSISFFPDGRVAYVNPALLETRQQQEISLPSIVETVRLLAAEMESISGAAKTRLFSIEGQPGAGLWRISFGYVCNGLTVREPALTALFEGAVMRELTMRPLYFEATNEAIELMPVDMATDLLTGEPGTYGDLFLCYGTDGLAGYYVSYWKGR